ncbi:MAG: glycosyltransferase family 4 protein [Saprospiraceae bacterium]
MTQMRILHLFDLYLPHTMNWAWRLMRATPQVEQWVAAPWMLRNEYSSPDFRFFTRPLQKTTGWLPPDEWQAEWFSANLIRAEKHWPMYQNWLFRQLKNKRPDVLHAHFAPVGCHYLTMAQGLNIPLVTSFYGFDYERLPFQKPAYRERYRQLFRSAAAITTTGELSAKLLERQSCPPEKIIPIPLGISPTEFPFLERKKTSGQLRLVQVATVTDKKGHLDTLAALQIALQNCPNLQLTFAGERQDKNLFQKIKNFIKANDLAQNVTLLDFLPHGDLPRFLGQFDAFIHPSRTTANRDCEGAPVVILEAQATGLPVISTHHADIPRQVLHGQTGLLAPERDPVHLAAHIKRLYHMDNDEYQQMSRAARAHVEQHFDVERTGEKLASLYSAIIHSS